MSSHFGNEDLWNGYNSSFHMPQILQTQPRVVHYSDDLPKKENPAQLSEIMLAATRRIGDGRFKLNLNLITSRQRTVICPLYEPRQPTIIPRSHQVRLTVDAAFRLGSLSTLARRKRATVLGAVLRAPPALVQAARPGALVVGAVLRLGRVPSLARRADAFVADAVLRVRARAPPAPAAVGDAFVADALFGPPDPLVVAALRAASAVCVDG